MNAIVRHTVSPEWNHTDRSWMQHNQRVPLHLRKLPGQNIAHTYNLRRTKFPGCAANHNYVCFIRDFRRRTLQTLEVFLGHDERRSEIRIDGTLPSFKRQFPQWLVCSWPDTMVQDEDLNLPKGGRGITEEVFYCRFFSKVGL